MIMLMPQYADDLFDGLAKTVNNSAIIIARLLGNQDGSQKTVQARLWGRSKPVAHAAAAVMLCFNAMSDPEQGWDADYELCYKQPFLASLFYEYVLET
jgi:hypothetical protein